MAELPHMPTKDEILAKAIELFQKDLMLKGLPVITPEEEELKEGNWFEKARAELMTGIRSELEKYLSDLESEADKIREELGIEKPLPTSERLTELEDKLARVEDRYKTTKERLKEAEEELRKIREAKPPPPPPVGLTEEDKTHLENLFKQTFIEAGVSYVEKMAEFRGELRRLQEDLKNIPRLRAVELAEREIIELAKRLIPYKPPPAVPETVPALKAELEEEKIKRREAEIKAEEEKKKAEAVAVAVEVAPPPIKEPVPAEEQVVSRECYETFRKLWDEIKKTGAMEVGIPTVSGRTGIGASFIRKALAYSYEKQLEKIEKLANQLIECQCEIELKEKGVGHLKCQKNSDLKKSI